MSADDPLRRRPPPPLPMTVITGFLGAGKTTLLNRLLADPALSGALVLINEFGEIGLDHLLIEKVDGDMVLMASGCLCCTIRGDLVDALEDALRRRDNGRIAPFNRVIVETTGLADPAPILHTIMHHPYLMMRFRLESVVTVVDAVNGAATLDAHAEAVKQAAVADRIVLTKTDLPEGVVRAAALRARLARLAPSARLLEAVAGEATASSLLDAGLYDPASKTADVRKWLAAEAVEASHRAHPHSHGAAAPVAPDHAHHHHAHGSDGHVRGLVHEHDVNRHDARIRAVCLRSSNPLKPGDVDLFLEMLRQLHGPSLLRVKGVLALTDDPSRPLVVHGVQHVFHPPVRLDAWPDEDHSSRMVFILRDLDPAHLRGVWAAFFREPQVDGPDREALVDNPLAPRAGGLLG